MNLEKFIQQIETYKARYTYPESISINAAIAFTARMCTSYPDIAKEWYDKLPKAVQD